MSPAAIVPHLFELTAAVTRTAATDSDGEDKHALLVAKIVAMVVLICITVFCGGLPYMLDRWLKWTKQSPEATRSSLVVQCLLFFGGGVLIATTFLHMLPEIIEVVERLQKCGILADTPFALPEMLMCTGFYLMYMIEELMHTIVHRNRNKLSKKESIASAAFQRGHSIRNSRPLSNEGGGSQYKGNNKSTAVAQQQHQHHSHMPISTTADDDDDGVSSSMRGLGIILALSLHELFEGMAIGLELTVGTVWFMFGAVSAHKLVLAFCVGMELLVARTRKALAITYIITFSIVTPIGIAIGIAISEQANANGPSVPSGILQGIACGTLLYVVFFEILSKSHSGWSAFFSSLVGFLLMFGLQILADEAEPADSDSCS